MIAQIRGKLLSRRPDHVVVDVGGVGYRVFVSVSTFCELPECGREVCMFTHTVVREDAIHLYGFAREAEWSAFASLVGVTGVGPKLAQSILSGIGPDDLWTAVRAGDAARLTKIPGVGKKTASRLVVELEGRLPRDLGVAAPPLPATPLADDAVSALVNLGYPEAKAAKAVEAALAKTDDPPHLEEVLRQALKGLAS